MSKLKPLVMGNLISQKPIIQGGMGVGISLSSLAGSVAREGGIGIISTAQIGFKDPDFMRHPIESNMRAIRDEFKKAREIAPNGIIGFNIMVATKQYEKYVRESVEAGADIIISGAGLPVSLPEYVQGSETKIAPIVSSVKSVNVICKMWDRKYHRAPDLVVIEGPLAGGHLGFSPEQLEELGADSDDVSLTYQSKVYDEEIKGIIKVVKQYADKYQLHIPVVVAGGIYSHDDVLHQIELGADGVQVATRFVTTKECDAPIEYKEAYIKAQKEDIIIVKSPVGMPGRAIKNEFLEKVKKEREPITFCYQCLEHCDIKTIPYCITKALSNAAEAKISESLLFCGSNAYRSNKIETVKEVMDDLMGI